jgi:glutamine synthetase
LSSNPKALILMCGVYCGPTPYSLNSKWDLCPRGALVRQIQRAEDEWGLKFLVGFEVEFQVMKQADRSWDGMLPLSIGLGHFATAGMLDPCWTVVEDCAEKLRSMGVRVASLHPEGLRGQYEIALSPSSPLQAVDELMLVRSVLKETFHSRGGTATLSPKPMAAGGQQMNGQHMHISIQHTNSDQEEWFLAGILKRLPNLWAILLAQKASYDRVAPWMAGDRIAWGTENRTVPIRRIRPNHWEIRGMDATANVYLALAAVLSAGLIGISNKEPLTWPDASSSKADIQGDPLPRSLSESLVKLEDNSCGLDQMLGERLVRHYIDLKRYELSQMEDMGSEKARNLLIEVF